MMEQGEETNFKALRERFQNNEASKIRIKPNIPEKPKTIPPVSPTAKLSNPLIANINSAVENRFAPRVVFKDNRKPHQNSEPEPSLLKPKPILLYNNQKKEGDLIKQAMKDRKMLPMRPVSPVLEQTPSPEITQKSPVLETQVTPPKKTISNKADIAWDVPATTVLDHSDSSISIPAKTEATNTQTVLPKALAPAIRTNPTITAPVISPPVVSVSKPPPVTVPEPVFRNGPQMQNPRSEIPTRLHSNVISPTADIFSRGSPDKEESHGIPYMDIPAPIIAEDYSDSGTSNLDIQGNVTPEHSSSGDFLFYTPTYSSPTLSYTAFSTPATETPNSSRVFTFSPLPACLSSLKNTKLIPVIITSPKVIDEKDIPLCSSPQVASALARAEEMAPVKHHSSDQRLLTLLEKAKRKSALGIRSSTPRILPVVHADLPRKALFESSPPETVHAEPFAHVDAPYSTEDHETQDHMIPVDYMGKAEEAAPTEYNTQPYETANNHDPRKRLPGPKIVAVQKPVMPPPPPPRKPQTVLNGSFTPEKSLQSPSPDMQSSILPSQPLKENGMIVPAPANFTSEDLTHTNSEIWNPSYMFSSQAEAPYYRSSVHEETFLKQFNLEHETPSMDTTDVGLPSTVTTEYEDSLPHSPLNSRLSSSSGNQINYSSLELEDLATNKKNKTAKKQRKGSPINPYAETSAVTEEMPKKPVFSKPNSVSDDKELKLKEKQRQKDKEKEKEKKEQKEKEKKEQKKKEQKERELKEKERDKKEKEKEKKGQKEKEKKENEIKKKFKITGEEEAIYQAKVVETTKGRKDDLAIKAGEIISVIRTTGCPKGKWLARDSTNKYGYIPVESVELNIQEMIALGNKAKASNRSSINGIIEPDASSTGIISSPRYSMNQESFEEDSEEWADEDDTVFTPTHTTDLQTFREQNQKAFPDFRPEPVPVLSRHTERSDNVQGKQETLHKLSTFFAHQKVPTLKRDTPIKQPGQLAVSPVAPITLPKPDADMQILPPPDLYADIVVG